MRRFAKTRSAPRNVYIAGRSVGSLLEVDETTLKRAEREEIEKLIGKGFIEEIKPPADALPAEPPPPPKPEPAPEPEPVGEEEPEATDDEVAKLIEDAEALEEMAEEAEEVPADELEKEEGDQGVEDEVTPEEPVFDLSPLDQSVKDLKGDIAHIDDPAWIRALKTAENLGKTRKSAITALKERLEELEG